MSGKPDVGALFDLTAEHRDQRRPWPWAEGFAPATLGGWLGAAIGSFAQAASAPLWVILNHEAGRSARRDQLIEHALLGTRATLEVHEHLVAVIDADARLAKSRALCALRSCAGPRCGATRSSTSSTATSTRSTRSQASPAR